MRWENKTCERGEQEKRKKKKTTTTERRNRVQKLIQREKKKILKRRLYIRSRWAIDHYSVTILYHLFFKLTATWLFAGHTLDFVRLQSPSYITSSLSCKLMCNSQAIEKHIRKNRAAGNFSLHRKWALWAPNRKNRNDSYTNTSEQPWEASKETRRGLWFPISAGREGPHHPA